jgi:hypothetical protein
MPAKIGIIAEDPSDVEVLKLLARKITGKSVSTAHFTGKGCGPLKKKTPGWCKDLAHKGCTKILLVHDLDRNDAKALRTTLEAILEKSFYASCCNTRGRTGGVVTERCFRDHVSAESAKGTESGPPSRDDSFAEGIYP